MPKQKPIYTPPPGLRTNLDDFREYVSKRHGLDLKDYHALHEFSIKRLNDFWLSVWDYAGIKASSYPSMALRDENGPIFPRPEWFPTVRMNFAENLLCGTDDAVAVIEMNETNQSNPTKYTWRDLKGLTAKFAGVLQRQGIRNGDVVVLIGGNSTTSLAFLLAAASVGAIFGSFATDIGQKSLLDRVGQLQPKVIIAQCQYHYNGKVNDISDKIEAAVNKTRAKLITTVAGSRDLRGSQTLESLLGQETAEDLRFEQVRFNHPFVVMFSSGTTGTPKGIVHSQGGLMINGIKEHLLHNNFGPSDIHFHFSGVGWTLWNISLGAMFTECAMVLYDGSPFYPDPDQFLRAIFATGVTGYGGSPRYFSELQKLDVRPKAYAGKMHTLLSTGALLTPGTASWLAEAFGPVCQVGFSGGTELCGNFMTGTRSMPCYAGEIAVKELGMDVEAFGPNGESLPDGEAGELVCKKPFPNMPVMFWNDPKQERYRNSYFAGFKDVWTHGDLIKVNPETKGLYVLGRSDGVLNPSGVRYGTSDLYNILSSPRFSSITQDGLAVGQQRNTDKYSDPAERVILFMKIAPEHSTKSLFPKEEILKDLRDQISHDLSRRHVPHFFFEAEEIPHNANGKKMEIQVKQVCNGGPDMLKKMTLTDAEREMLTKFAKYYDIEDVVNQQKRASKL